MVPYSITQTRIKYIILAWNCNCFIEWAFKTRFFKFVKLIRSVEKLPQAQSNKSWNMKL